MSDLKDGNPTASSDVIHGKVANLASFRLEKIAPPRAEKEGGGKPDNARLKILTGLEELRSVTSKADYERALQNGVAFSIDGFRVRNKVGNTALRKTNSDLLEKLKMVLNFIFTDILRSKRNGSGRSKGDPSMRKIGEWESKARQLQVLLDRRDIDSRLLVDELKGLRREIIRLQALLP